MRIIILLLLGLLILAILVVSDFFLLRSFNEKIKDINSAARKFIDFSPISLFSISAIALLFWLVPISLLPENFQLEYRVFITIFYWLLITLSFRLYYRSKLPIQIVRQLLLFTIIPAICLGVFIVPIVTLLKDTIK